MSSNNRYRSHRACNFIISIVFLFCLYKSNAQAPVTVPAAYSTSTRVNSVRSWTATAPVQAASTLITKTLADVKQSTQYYDGFGRPTEIVAKQASPLGNDLVTANCYDVTTGNEIYQFIPFISNVATPGNITNDGNFKNDPFQEQVAFYNTYLSGQPSEINIGPNSANWAYGQVNYETSPANRVLNTYAPGANWVGSNGSSTQHNIQQQLMGNTATDGVPIWNIGAWTASNPQVNILPVYSGQNYGAGTLYKTISTDEQGIQHIEFKDFNGQVILKKEQIQSSGSPYTPFDNGLGSGYTGWISTFYIYDDHGNLRFVITPNLVAQMATAGLWTLTLAQADELCYRYEYDQLGRMVVKKTPGTPSGALGEVWMVYDLRNRLVMEQDGNMRSATVKKWQYFQHDDLDRPIAKGLITDLSHYTDLNYNLTNAAVSPNPSSSIPAWPVLANYSTTELLGQSFYDNYTNIPSPLSHTIDASTNGTGNTTAFTTSSGTWPYPQPLTQTLMTQGLITGTKAEVLGSNGAQYISSVNFYDGKGRTIQTQSTNYTTGKDITTTQYDWSGKPASNMVAQAYVSTLNPQSHLLVTKMTYDFMGRLLTVNKAIASTVNSVALTAPSTNPTTILSCTYDEMGRMLNKSLGSLETLAYGYNIRGWLSTINQAYIAGTSSTNSFGMELAYDKNTSAAPNNTYLFPAFNGNIGGTVWKSKGDGINRKYDLSYDNANRLAAAAFLQNSAGSTWDNSFIDFSVSGIGYDANGNINGVNQNGFAQGGKLQVDQLTYNYIAGAGNSNRLNYVADVANVTNSTLGDFHFPGAPKTSSSIDYTYDADGNAISDNNRSISNISYYAYPNLPQLITTTKGSIAYTYDATGTKLRKQVIENSVTIPSIMVNNVQLTNVLTNITTTTTYVNGFVYKSISYSNTSLLPLNNPNTDILQFISTEEGRLRFKPAVGTVVMNFVHDYLIRDHLGNIRVGLTDEQQQDIYPAVTGETTSVTVSGTSNTAQNYEALYHSFNPADFVATSSLGAWYTSMLSGFGQILNENNSGTPVNNDPYSQTTSQSQQVYSLSGNTASSPTGNNFGLGITLKVMAGDNINILGTSFWHNTGSMPAGNYPVSAVLANLLGTFGGSSAVTSTISHSVLDGSAFDATATGPTGALLSPMLDNSPVQTGTQAPYAGINYVIFDDQFRPQGTVVGMDLVSTSSDAEKPHNVNVPISKSGYIYIYVSNQSPINVYFDNLQVIHTRGILLEEAHYYPSGLLMAGISDRAWNKLPNNFHYQGKEMQNQEWNDGTGLEEYDFSARFYDQQLGRWHIQDPANQYTSPYLGMGNSWPNGTDPNGRWFGTDDILVSAIGFLAGYLSYGITKGNWGGKALLTGLGSAVLAEGAYLTLGGGLAAAPAGVSAAGAGGAGSISAASSFGISFTMSDAFSVFSNKNQISNASDWGSLGLIDGYALSAAITAGFGSDFEGNKIDDLVGYKESDDYMAWWSSFKH